MKIIEDEGIILSGHNSYYNECWFYSSELARVRVRENDYYKYGFIDKDGIEKN